jgi:hypothetical protein
MGDRKEIPREHIDDESTLGKCFVITGGDKNVRELTDPEERVRKVLVNTLELYDPFKIYTLNFYYHLFDYNVFEHIDRKREIVSGALADVECYEITSNRVEDYPRLIGDYI